MNFRISTKDILGSFKFRISTQDILNSFKLSTHQGFQGNIVWLNMWVLSLFKSSKQIFLFPVCIFKFSSDRMLTNYIGWEYWMLFNNWTIGKFLLINWYLEYGMYVVVVWISNVATVVVVAYFVCCCLLCRLIWN